MIIRILFTAVVGGIFTVLQSTLFSHIIPFDFVPDFALIFFIAISWYCGALPGLVSGFIIGLNTDLLSLAPLGFHAFIYTFAGYLFGRLHDQITPGIVIMPMVAALTATLIKYGGAWLLNIIFALQLGSSQIFTLNTLWEVIANALLAPLVFFLAKIATKALSMRRGGF